jgi:hypothetical protein
LEAVDTVSYFIAAWNTTDDEERLSLLNTVCLSDAAFYSPKDESHGVDAMCRAIGAFRKAFPVAVVEHGPVQEHHGWLRFRWQTRPTPDAEPFFGEDIAELAPDGRIARLVSFDGYAEAGDA